MSKTCYSPSILPSFPKKKVSAEKVVYQEDLMMKVSSPKMLIFILLHSLNLQKLAFILKLEVNQILIFVYFQTLRFPIGSLAIFLPLREVF